VSHYYYAGFEVLRKMVVKVYIFGDIVPCSLLRSTDVSEEYIICAREQNGGRQRVEKSTFSQDCL
jgi:hypothetical protein